MFPEYRVLADQLTAKDPHFIGVFNRHRDLDRKIVKMESRLEPATHEQIEVLKKKKLALKDQLYQMLQKAGGA